MEKGIVLQAAYNNESNTDWTSAGTNCPKKRSLRMLPINLIICDNDNTVFNTIKRTLDEDVTITCVSSAKDVIDIMSAEAPPSTLIVVNMELLDSQRRIKFFEVLKHHSNIEVMLWSTETPPNYKSNSIFNALNRFPICHFNVTGEKSRFAHLFYLYLSQIRVEENPDKHVDG